MPDHRKIADEDDIAAFPSSSQCQLPAITRHSKLKICPDSNFVTCFGARQPGSVARCWRPPFRVKTQSIASPPGAQREPPAVDRQSTDAKGYRHQRQLPSTDLVVHAHLPRRQRVVPKSCTSPVMLATRCKSAKLLLACTGWYASDGTDSVLRRARDIAARPCTNSRITCENSVWVSAAATSL
jgi:hypothetical protein